MSINLRSFSARRTGSAFVAVAGFIFLFLLSASLCRAQESAPESEYTPAQIEKALLSFRQRANASAVEKSSRLLEEAGKDAFPILLKYLSSQIAVDQKYCKSELWEIDPQTHFLKGRRPVTLGDIAFQFIQNAIEEDFPRKFKIFQVLTRENVTTWLKKNKFLSLYEMRAQAAQEALAKAEAQHRQEPSEHTADAVQYMRQLAARYGQGR